MFVYKHTYKNNRISEKLAYFLRKMQTLRVNNSRILEFNCAKFSGHSFFLYERKHIVKYSNLHQCTFESLAHSKYIDANVDNLIL